VFWLEDIEMGALDCGLSLGEGTEILDACHINGYHFWNFDLTYPGQIAVMSDGQTVAMRFGAVDSLDAKGCGTIWGRVVFTAEATRGWFAFANLALDTDATLEIADAHWLQITNMYVTTAGNSPRPLINANAGTVQLSHVVVVGNAALAQPLLSVRGADVTVHGINAIAYNLASNAVFVDGGTLRMSGARVYAAAASAYTQPLVLQSGTGQLRVTDLDLRGVTGSSGTGLRINADNSPNYVGNVILSAGWVNSYAGTANGNYGPMLPSTGGSMSGSLFLMNGMIFNPFRVATPGDNSKHIDLYQNTYGFNITNDGNLNYNAAGAHVFRVNGAMVGYIFNDLNIPIGGTTPNPGSFTTLSASGTISGTGFSTFLNAPPTIGVTTPNVGSFTVLGTSGAVYLHAAANGGSYTNDALAAAGGVQPHQVYRNGSALMVRVT
jgi:hypothetical protein